MADDTPAATRWRPTHGRGVVLEFPVVCAPLDCYSDSMKGTTIKVEGALLAELEQAKPKSQSLSAYVRAVLEREVRRRKMLDAAERYTDFLRANDDERGWLEDWDRADLAGAPKRKRR